MEVYLGICVIHTVLSVSRYGNLTWHNGLIPDGETWIKIGGDKGGGSIKFAFQLANLEKPNSTEDTVVFTMFEACYSPHNLHTALDR